MTRRALLAGVGVAMLGLAGGIAVADGDVPPGDTPPDVETPGHADEAAPPAVTAPPSLPTVKREKLDGSLAAVADAAAMSGEVAALTIAQANGLTTERGAVRVLVETDNPDLAPARAAIVAAGGTVEGEYADTIQALVPPSGLDALAASPDVRYVRAPARGMPRPGPGRLP